MNNSKHINSQEKNINLPSSPEIFTYPPDNFIKEKFTNFQDIKAYFKSNNPYGLKYNIKKTNTTIYLYCSQCQSKIIFIALNGYLDIKAFHNQHNHNLNDIVQLLKPDLIGPRKNGKDQMLIDQSNDNFQKKNKKQQKVSMVIEQEVTQRLDITNVVNLIDFFAQLTRCKYQYHCQQYDQQILNILVVSPNMKKNYVRFGQNIFIQILKNKINVQCNNGIGLPHLIVFSGMDNNQRRLTFGYGFMLEQDSGIIYDIILEFIKIMNKCPQSIMSKFDQSINEAVFELKKNGYYTGIHVFDSQNILKQLKERNQNVIRNKERQHKQFKLYARALMVQTQEQFQQTITQLQKICKTQQQRDTLEMFLSQSYFTCFSRIPQRFLGFSIAGERPQSIGEQIEQSFGEKIINICEIASWMNEYEQKQLRRQFIKIPLQRYFNRYGLKIIRKKVQNKVFQRFLRYYILSQKYQVNQVISQNKKSTFVVSNPNTHYFITFHSGKYRCTCKMTPKIGLPCPHLIRFAQYKKIELWKLLNERWMVNENKVENNENSEDEQDRDFLFR